MSEPTTVLAQHQHSGERFALTLTHDGCVIACCGPLHYREVKEWIENDTPLALDEQDAEWANDQPWHFPRAIS
jgi:hypothetical protein